MHRIIPTYHKFLIEEYKLPEKWKNKFEDDLSLHTEDIEIDKLIIKKNTKPSRFKWGRRLVNRRVSECKRIVEDISEFINLETGDYVI